MTIPLEVLQAITTATAEVAKNAGATDLFIIVCSPTRPDGKFNRVGYLDADANKLIPTLAQFIRQRMPEPYKTRLVELITQPEPQQENPQDVVLPAEPPKWMN